MNGGLLWVACVLLASQCRGERLSLVQTLAPEGQQPQQLAGAGGGLMNGAQLEKASHGKGGSDPLKPWRVEDPKAEMAAEMAARQRDQAQAEADAQAEDAAQGDVVSPKDTSAEEAAGAEGYHAIPGLTIDSPAIARMEQATLHDCVDACNRVHMCTGVQFSQDTSIKGGNCLIMERRVQFSTTFDYYERPGISEAQVKAMDAEMLHKWSHEDQEETHERTDELGGLSTMDIPGSEYVDAAKEAKEQAKARALKEASDAIAQINRKREEAKQDKIAELQQKLTAKEQRVQSASKQAQELGLRVKSSAQAASLRAKESSKAQLESAKTTLSMSEVTKKSRNTIRELKEAEAKTKQYYQAHKAYKMAGNPMAAKMEHSFKTWQGILQSRKSALMKYRERRLVLTSKASEEKARARELKQQAAWSKMDHQDLVKRAKAAEQLQVMMQQQHDAVKKQLNDINAPAVEQTFRISSAVVSK